MAMELPRSWPIGFSSITRMRASATPPAESAWQIGP
jgi:hypothetical protein